MCRWRIVDTMISLVLFFPLFTISYRTQMCVKQQFISTYWPISAASTSSRLHMKHIQQGWKTQPHHPTIMSSSSSGLIPTEVPHNINTQQFCLLASFREKRTPFHPSQHVVLLPLVYSPFRPGRESWVQLATQRCGMTLGRAGAHVDQHQTEGDSNLWKLCWSQNYKLGVLKPFLFWWEECPFF